MGTIDERGYTPDGLQAIIESLQADWRSVFGADLAIDPETPQAQTIGLIALKMSLQEEEVARVVAQMNPNTSTGLPLDDLLDGLLGISRDKATPATAVVTLSGVDGTVIPALSVVASSTGEHRFITTGAVTIPASGSIDVVMESEDTGPLDVAAGELTNIRTPTPGWTGATNDAPAFPGTAVATDPSYRAAGRESIGRLQQGTIEAMEAALRASPGVTLAQVIENDTTKDEDKQGLTIPAHSILSIVRGGTDADIALTIATSKPGGMPTAGSTTVGAIRFERVVETAVKVAITVKVGLLWPADGQQQIKDALAAYATANWTMGEDVDPLQLVVPAYTVPGHVVSGAPLVRDSQGQALPANPTLNELYTLDEADVTVTLS